jgi:dipeptidyl aminopeptidase/acylaminoacyl peptidase
MEDISPVNQSIIVNAVTHLNSMCYNSDITDWIFAEALKSDILYNLTEEQVSEMYKRSPISVASQVNIPVLLLAGGSDARVPSFNNMELYRILKGKGVDVTMAWYPSDGHGLTSPASSMDLTARILLWLQDKRKAV